MKFSKIEICDVRPTPAVWITRDSKCVSVEVRRRPSPSHHQLVTQNLQDAREGRVQVYDIMYEERNCMAFCFEVGNKALFPFTDGKDIQFTVLSSKEKVTLNEKFLFQYGEAGTKDWRSLKSVAEPSMFLFSEDNENKVTITSVEKPHFRIEKKGETRTSESERFYIPKKLDITPYERKSRDSNCAATKGKPRRVRRSLKAKCFC